MLLSLHWIDRATPTTWRLIIWAGYLRHNPPHCKSWPICTAVERQWWAAPAHEHIATEPQGSSVWEPWSSLDYMIQFKPSSWMYAELICCGSTLYHCDVSSNSHWCDSASQTYWTLTELIWYETKLLLLYWTYVVQMQLDSYRCYTYLNWCSIIAALDIALLFILKMSDWKEYNSLTDK